MCLTLPEGEVHQCNEGHCYCVDCWRELNPRRCPECRQPISDNNRSRAAERAIAALEATCEHCAEVTTRGAMAAHLHACPQRPTACAGAAAGCGAGRGNLVGAGAGGSGLIVRGGSCPPEAARREASISSATAKTRRCATTVRRHLCRVLAKHPQVPASSLVHSLPRF